MHLKETIILRFPDLWRPIILSFPRLAPWKRVFFVLYTALALHSVRGVHMDAVRLSGEVCKKFKRGKPYPIYLYLCTWVHAALGVWEWHAQPTMRADGWSLEPCAITL